MNTQKLGLVAALGSCVFTGIYNFLLSHVPVGKAATIQNLSFIIPVFSVLDVYKEQLQMTDWISAGRAALAMLFFAMSEGVPQVVARQ